MSSRKPKRSAAAQAAFEDLARRLAAGEDFSAARVHAVVLASGRTFEELEAACDRFAARQGRRRIAASK